MPPWFSLVEKLSVHRGLHFLLPSHHRRRSGCLLNPRHGVRQLCEPSPPPSVIPHYLREVFVDGGSRNPEHWRNAGDLRSQRDGLSSGVIYGEEKKVVRPAFQRPNPHRGSFDSQKAPLQLVGIVVLPRCGSLPFSLAAIVLVLNCTDLCPGRGGGGDGGATDRGSV
ncbi:hypothetical protein Dimus_004479 [Dionaea muscipula]